MDYTNKKRARRRNDHERMKRKAFHIGAVQNAMKYWREDEHCNSWRANIQRYWVRNAEHMACCSCTMCGNPRRNFGHRTLQEQWAFQKEE